MDINEFKAWLDGYMEAGGKDINRVREKLLEVAPIYPLGPQVVPSPWVVPNIIPLIPSPWIIPSITIPNSYPWITWQSEQINITSGTIMDGVNNMNDLTKVTSCAMAD